MRIRLDYYDHNEEFSRILPQDGWIERFVSSATDNNWGLLKLDTSIEYDGNTYNYLLLRSRWQGSEIGDKEPTSVFVLLVGDVQNVSNGFDTNEFLHVAWGMAHRMAK